MEKEKVNWTFELVRWRSESLHNIFVCCYYNFVCKESIERHDKVFTGFDKIMIYVIKNVPKFY